MKITRLYTGGDGESHFGYIEVPLENIRDKVEYSEPIKATGILFREIGVELNPGWHNAPRRQFVIVLEGTIEIEVGDGTKCKFHSGDIFLAEDTTGRGHITREVDNRPRKTVAVTLD